MQYLLDTNCWMQLVRRREHAETVADFLRTVPASNIFITDYALHSLVNIARRHKILNELPVFIERSGFGKTGKVINAPPTQLRRVNRVVNDHNLDVDDAYQYVAADLHGLKLVSLDSDFDRTPDGRLNPAAALQRFKDEQRQQDA